MRKFNSKTFIIVSAISGLLLIPSFLAAWADDEGTLGTNVVVATFSNLFYLLRFPTHTVMWTVFSNNAVLFFLGSVINCMFYGFLFERLFSFVQTTKQSN
jgi:hypothetical protein